MPSSSEYYSASDALEPTYPKDIAKYAERDESYLDMLPKPPVRESHRLYQCGRQICVSLMRSDIT